METYHRKRSKYANEANNTEMMNLKRQEESTVDGAQYPSLPRHVLPTSDCILQSNDEMPDEHSIEVGSIYEIDHTKLPTRTPVQLRSIRVVMVSEKTELNVAVRFPSVDSLRTYFSNRIREMYPALDMKFVMGTKAAREVLHRQVSSQEFAEKKHLESFWLLSSVPIGGFGDIISKKETCLTSEIKCNGLVRWGVRRQVKFLGKHRENINLLSSSSFITGGGKTKEEEDQEQEDGNEEEEDEEEKGDEESVTEETRETNRNLKRKRHSLRSVQKAKMVKQEKQRPCFNTKSKNKCKQIVLKNPTDRWSKERYKSAEQNLLEVMKVKGAVFGNPILRPALRAEARKRIGDTGLLDHLLKHMAGKVAPGGVDRFRRRHNADGAMEYWLESSDLVNIRREAGVQDPYWTPPPGWKAGDSPTQDPTCAKELNLLKEEIFKMKKDLAEMVPMKKFLEEMAHLKREMEEKRERSQAIVVSNPGAISQQEEIRKPTSKVEEKTNAGSELMVSTTTVSCAEKERKQVRAEKIEALALVQEAVAGGERKAQKAEPQAQADEKTAAAAAEEKAAKIQRLKSGFRICKPQGTFLWPNMVRNTNNNNSSNMLSPQVVVQVEDLFVVPTPPSVSSSTASAPPQLPYHNHHHHPSSPVKPLAEKRAVTVTVSTVSKAPGPEDGNNHYTTTTTTTTTTTKDSNKTTTLIDLNDIPTDPCEGYSVGPSSRQTVTTTTTMPRFRPSMKIGSKGATIAEGKDMMGYSKRQQRGCSSSSASCLSTGEGTWLGLATSNTASDDSSRG